MTSNVVFRIKLEVTERVNGKRLARRKRTSDDLPHVPIIQKLFGSYSSVNES